MDVSTENNSYTILQVTVHICFIYYIQQLYLILVLSIYLLYLVEYDFIKRHFIHLKTTS